MASKRFSSLGYIAATTLDNLSKTALGDLLVDLIRRQHGLDISDREVLRCIQRYLPAIQRVRGDQPINLLARAETVIGVARASRKRMLEGGWTNTVDVEPIIAAFRDGALAENIEPE